MVQVLGPDHPHIVIGRHTLADVLHSLGQLKRPLISVDDPSGRQWLVQHGGRDVVTVRVAAAARLMRRRATSMRAMYGGVGGVHPSCCPMRSSTTTSDKFAISNEIVAAHSLDDVGRHPDFGSAAATLRWMLIHMVEETARHVGHQDTIRELWAARRVTSEPKASGHRRTW